MVGSYTTNTRPRLSTLKNKFKEIEAAIPGMFDKIQNPNAASVSDEDYELFFVEFPLNPAGMLVELDDQTALCRVFMDIKENTKRSNFRGEYSYIDQAKYDELERVSDFKAMAEAANNQDEETNTSSLGTPGKRRRVDSLFADTTADTEKTSELRSTLDAKTRELELLKGNYSALERSAFDIRSTAQAAIDELTTAGAGKDAAIATLTASNASKDARILELAAAAANLETKCGEVDRLRRLVEKTKDELAARDAEILELRKPSTAGPASAKDQHQGLLQFKAGAGKYDAAMKQVRDLEAKLKTATDEMNRLYGEVNRLEQEVERAAPPASSGGGGPGWADQFVLSNAKWVVVVSPCLFLFFFQLPPLTTAAHAGSTWRSSRGSPCTSRRRRCCAWRRSCWTRRWRSSR